MFLFFSLNWDLDQFCTFISKLMNQLTREKTYSKFQAILNKGLWSSKSVEKVKLIQWLEFYFQYVGLLYLMDMQGQEFQLTVLTIY